MTSRSGRTADHPIHPIFLERWSPRRFSGEPISDAQLAVLFEKMAWWYVNKLVHYRNETS